ncbi:uncharacterized protein RB166_001560 [Leptodactylus fuscus]|uniref:uncharacterized protein LOC142195906 n=1 Tax=Leptodactylus fuscus TaxID=238119 RepID=UPI003F4EBFB2
MSPPDICALCKSEETNGITGEMLQTPDRSVVAHYNCMLYSPMVISRESQDEGFEFDIESVLAEIERGRKLRCNYCRKQGATSGCDVKSCRRTYHLPCLIQANGSVPKDRYVVYCVEHTKRKADKGSEGFKRGRKRKRWLKSVGNPRKNDIKKPHYKNGGIVDGKTNDQSEASFMLPIHSTISVDSIEDVLPSTSGNISGSRIRRGTRIYSESSSEESDSILNPKVTQTFSLRGFPKRKPKYSSSRKPNEKLDEVLKTFSSEDKAALSQMYSELGGSQQSLTIEMAEVQDNTNDIKTKQFVLNGVVSDTSTCSDTSDKTPERLPDIVLDKDLEAPGTPEMMPAGCPETEPESAVGTPLTTKEEGNKAEGSTEVNRQILPTANCRNVTMEDEEGQTKGSICNIVSQQQITAISRKLATGAFSKTLEPIVQKLQNTIYSPKRNTTKDEEKIGQGKAIAEGSPDSCTEDQTVENYPHENLQNQESSDDPFKKSNLVCDEESKSMASKEKLFQELLGNAPLQQTEENLPEQPMINEDPREYNSRENAPLEEAATPASVKSKRATEHQSGPSRLSTRPRRRLFGSLRRPTNQLHFQHEGLGGLDGINGFGHAVAGQCRRLSVEKQAKYMSYVLASADLFHAHATLPELETLITNLRTTLQKSQQSAPGNGSSV